MKRKDAVSSERFILFAVIDQIKRKATAVVLTVTIS